MAMFALWMLLLVVQNAESQLLAGTSPSSEAAGRGIRTASIHQESRHPKTPLAKPRVRRDSDAIQQSEQLDPTRFNEEQEEDDAEIYSAIPETKRFTSFRSDLGKRKAFRSDLGRKRSYGAKKRFTAFRSDLGKRFAPPSPPSSALSTADKRFTTFRSDLGKRSFDVDNDDDDDVQFDTDKRYSSFRSDLGEPNPMFEVQLSSKNAEMIPNYEEKRFTSFRSDLGKRQLPVESEEVTENKRAGSYFRSDLGKRTIGFRSDLGK